MTRIIPVPTTRVSDILFQQRLLAQLQSDQLDLFRLQTQVSTGRRITLPSEDAPAARRAISLQRLLERKEQVQANLITNQSYLAATDTALSGVSNQLSEIRGVALGVTGVTTTDTERAAVVQQVDEAIRALVELGNQRFRGRFLFAGSQTTVQPFNLQGQQVRYDGDENEIRAFSDVEILTPTNAHGDDVFGALSASVRGTADLNPILTEDTLLADLRGGRGISEGSILVSDGTSSVTIDLSTAETVGDVARLIENNAPAGNSILTTITGSGLTIELASGTLSLLEVGGGITASDLGILEEAGAVGGVVVGSDLDPRLRLTTSVLDILGVRASARVESVGLNNDFFIEADTRGPALNNITISFADTAAAGNETVTYDAFAQTLVIGIDAGLSTAADVINAINNDPTVGALLTATLDDRDTSLNSAAGTGVIELAATALTSGGSGIEFDQTGLQINNGGQTFAISFAAANTIEDVLNILNGSGAGVLAELNAEGTGINIRSRLSGTDFSIGENGGTTATELGVRSLTDGTPLAGLNHGLGVHDRTGSDFLIRRKDGAAIEIDVAGAQTIQDIIDAINAHPNNTDGAVVARLAVVGNGIELATSDPATVSPFQVERLNLSDAASDLGLIPVGADVSDPAVPSGGEEVITPRDVNPAEVEGVFTALLRLRQAILDNDLLQIERSIELLDDSQTELNFTRAEIGARQQNLDVVRVRLENEQIQLIGTLSEEIDVDIAEAISSLVARQASFQASLQMAATTFQLTLLNYL